MASIQAKNMLASNGKLIDFVLSHPLTINGRQFDGSEDVTVNVSGGSGSYDDTEIRELISEKDDKPMIVEFVPESGNMSRMQLADIPVVAENYSFSDVVEAYQSARRVYARIDIDGTILLELMPSNEHAITFSYAAINRTMSVDKVLLNEEVEIFCDSYDQTSDGKIHGRLRLFFDSIPVANVLDGEVVYPNPSKLKLTGAVSAEYDGSEEVTVNIPTGGGSSYDDTEIRQMIEQKQDKPTVYNLQIVDATPTETTVSIPELTFDELKDMLDDGKNIEVSMYGMKFSVNSSSSNAITFLWSDFDGSHYTSYFLRFTRTTGVLTGSMIYDYIELAKKSDVPAPYNDTEIRQSISQKADKAEIPTDSHINDLIDAKITALDGSGVRY